MIVVPKYFATILQNNNFSFFVSFLADIPKYLNGHALFKYYFV